MLSVTEREKSLGLKEKNAKILRDKEVESAHHEFYMYPYLFGSF